MFETIETQLQHPTNDMQPTQALQQMIVGSWISQAIYVVAQLGVANLLKDGSKSYKPTPETKQSMPLPKHPQHHLAWEYHLNLTPAPPPLALLTYQHCHNLLKLV